MWYNTHLKIAHATSFAAPAQTLLCLLASTSPSTLPTASRWQ
jgi:hypothetical protein